MSLHVVLVEPEIPQNTGNIARTCAATGAKLHLIRPLGFSLDDKYMRRAGLDYWFMADVDVYDDMQAFLAAWPGLQMVYATTKAPRDYAAVRYGEDACLVFGKETKGLPEEMLAAHYDECVRIPMRAGARSLNLANSVAILVYEALRQRDFVALERAGQLRGAQAQDVWRDYL